MDQSHQVLSVHKGLVTLRRATCERGKRKGEDYIAGLGKVWYQLLLVHGLFFGFSTREGLQVWNVGVQRLADWHQERNVVHARRWSQTGAHVTVELTVNQQRPAPHRDQLPQEQDMHVAHHGGARGVAHLVSPD